MVFSIGPPTSRETLEYEVVKYQAIRNVPRMFCCALWPVRREVPEVCPTGLRDTLTFSDKLILALCVGTYFLLSGIVTLLDYTVIKGTNFVVKDKGGDVHVGIAMGKGESHVTMSFRRGTQSEKFKVEIEKLFDEEGVLLQTPTLNVFESNYSAFLGKKDKKTN